MERMYKNVTHYNLLLQVAFKFLIKFQYAKIKQNQKILFKNIKFKSIIFQENQL